MPWTPQNDFEEEVVNLQPDHDFIFGSLSEPQYPRPTAHTEYAATRKLQEKEQNNIYGANSAISAKLRVIQQVQRIAHTKPVGEQPNLDDWDNNEHLEQETISMMRHFGMSANIEHPLNEGVTISSYPVQNTNMILKNGRRKVALFLDDNLFKLREKVPDTSSGSGDRKNTKLEVGTSFSTTSSNSYTTAEDTSFSAGLSKITGNSFNQYEKLIEDTSLLSLNSSKDSLSSHKETSDSFRTCSKASWTPPSDDDDHNISFNKNKDWPTLSKHKTKKCHVDPAEESNYLFSNTQTDSSTADISSETNSNESKRTNFLDRFIKSDNTDNLNTTSGSTSKKSSKDPNTYASIIKTPKTSAKKKGSSPPADFVTNFPTFYTTRKMYALKRNQK